MTTNETNQLIDRCGQLSVERGQLQIAVTIQDARSVYGRTEVLVKPESCRCREGIGEAWVNLERVNLK